ncbi:hypothetical protein LTR93_011844 [Exophiala xenobiotica]|nr:hypothetical protein LTR93_011844 [Exophiala xenobiotica]
MKELLADYVVGCDGANSLIRSSLLGDDFPGSTWDLQIIATNTYYDFEKYGWDHANFAIHPDNYYMAAKMQSVGMWRVRNGEVAGLTAEEYRSRQPGKFAAMLPGNPTPDQYRITNFSPYKVHQLLASKMVVGIFILSADAAHLCNPLGGMGLTGGLVDVGNLLDCPIGIHAGRADTTILDKYNDVRRQKYEQYVNPFSTANMKRWHRTPMMSRRMTRRSTPCRKPITR